MIEVAKGADMTAANEAKELDEKGFLLSSCCPAFVDYVRKNFPNQAEHLSSCLSPMGMIARKIKEEDEDCRLIFIGPCTAKKAEILRDEVKGLVDVALTFEELQALFDSRDIDLSLLEDSDLNQASYFGRVFARSGGLTEAMAQGLKEIGSEVELKAETCAGIDMCKVALIKKDRGMLNSNFVEGMACNGGCIGGAGTLLKFDVKKERVDDYAKQSPFKTIEESLDQK